jgi:hypothetical protein
VLGRRDHVDCGAGDHDAALGGGGNVDVVDADAGPADHAQAVGAPMRSAVSFAEPMGMPS